MQTPRPTPPHTQLQQDDFGLQLGHGSPPGSPKRRSASLAALIRHSSALAMSSGQPPDPARLVSLCPDILQGMRKFERELSEEMLRHSQGTVRRLAGLLASDLRKSRHEYRPMAIRLMLLGEDETSIRPYIVVFCPELVRKRAEKFFKKDMIRGIYQSDEPGRETFQVAVVGQAPQPRADESTSLVKVAPAYTANLAYPGNTSGSLRVKAEHDGVSRLATIGGYIVASCHDGIETIYGLTAGHIFPQTRYNTSSSDQPSDGTMPSPASSDSDDDDDITLENANQNSSRGAHESFTITKNEPYWTDVKLADVSFSREARDKDWALVEGLQTHQIDSLDIGATNATIALGAIGEQQLLQIGFDAEVALKCVLSPTPSMILTPSGHNFVQAHILTPDASRRLQDGASGTWVTSQPAQVLNRNANPISVYGQVVADDVFGDVYMIPLRCIMDDVKTLMDAAVIRLPASIKELRQILVDQLHREHTILDHGKSSKAPHSLTTDATAERINHDAYPGIMLDHSVVLESPTQLLSGKPKRSISVRKPKCHICGTCGRSYTRKEHLKRHEQNHAQGVPFRCSQCTKSFYRRDLLERHEARHQDPLSAEIEHAETQTDYAEIDDEDVRDPTTNGNSRREKISDMIVSPTRNFSALLHPRFRSVYVEDDCDDDLSSNSHGAPKAKKSRTEAPWTSKEDLCLKRMRSEGASWNRIMETFSDRPEKSVKKHWYKDLHREGMTEEAPASVSMPEPGE